MGMKTRIAPTVVFFLFVLVVLTGCQTVGGTRSAPSEDCQALQVISAVWLGANTLYKAGVPKNQIMAATLLYAKSTRELSAMPPPSEEEFNLYRKFMGTALESEDRRQPLILELTITCEFSEKEVEDKVKTLEPIGRKLIQKYL